MTNSATPPSRTAYPRSIPTLFTVLAVAAAALGFVLLGCDSDADQGIRRDQLGSDVRSGRNDSDLESEVRSRSGLANPRFNSITITPPPPTDGSGSSITLTAEGSISTVEIADGVATCLETGEVSDSFHLIGADLKSGTITLTANGSTTMTCPAHEIDHVANKPPSDSLEGGTYQLWVGDLGQ